MGFGLHVGEERQQGLIMYAGDPDPDLIKISTATGTIKGWWGGDAGLFILDGIRLSSPFILPPAVGVSDW